MNQLIYKPPLFFSNGHIQTIYPSIFRKIPRPSYIRERIDTPDNDFLDLDWSYTGKKRLAVISHGLEGNSERKYVMAMVKAVNSNGWDALAWNCRTCSGEPNRLLRMYHNGATDDLDTVIKHAEGMKKYENITLIGFSLGGNLNLLYLGEKGREISPLISSAVAISVPCDLEASSYELAKFKNRLYMKRFLSLLHKKVRAKMNIMPGLIDDKNYHLLKNFKDFDNRYTAPIHGFRDAEDYWHKCSSLRLLHKIKVPALIINAMNDPFLTGKCYPYEESLKNKNITLEIPDSGGHVGFIYFKGDGQYWSESRTLIFIEKPGEKFTQNF